MSNLHRVQWIDSRIREARYPNCSDIAREFCISVRQASRDIEYLKYSLGAPLEYSQEKRGYYYSEKTFVLPTLLLTEEDKRALLYIADRYKAGGTDMTRRLAALFKKLGAGEREADEKIEKLPIIGVSDTRVSISERLNLAAEQKKKVRIVYLDFGNKKTERMIHPYVVFFQHAKAYVHGFCELRNAERDFRIDRIRFASLANESFVVPASFDAARFERPVWFDYRVPYEAVVRFERAIDETKLQNAKKTDTNTYTIGFKSSRELISLLVSSGPGFMVAAPSWLRKKCSAFFLKMFERNS